MGNAAGVGFGQNRKVYVAGITRNPTDAWMRQAARNLTSGGCDLLAKCRYLIRDRDAKFSSGFDMIMRSVGMEPLALPPRSPGNDRGALRREGAGNTSRHSLVNFKSCHRSLEKCCIWLHCVASTPFLSEKSW